MHIYFSGLGGAGIGPLALIAKQAGFSVSGSDKQESQYIANLKKHGVDDIHIGQTYEQIAGVHAREPIDWFVYTSALPIEHPDAPELRFCAEHHIKTSKRDEFINLLLEQKNLDLIAIAGTHGKTTTTAMAIWLFKRLGVPVSYSVGAKMSFGGMGEFDPASKYFVYEADEFDRNFLAFRPAQALIAGIDWDHPDIYPTQASYNEAFRDFLAQSKSITMWRGDLARLDMQPAANIHAINEADVAGSGLTLPGEVNRMDAWLVAEALQPIVGQPIDRIVQELNAFPGIGRRFEQLASNLYSDYAHTAPKIRGALQLAHEVAGANVVVVYEGLHNTRQHFMKADLKHLFDSVKHLYIVPTYLAREDPNLALMQPSDLQQLLSPEAQAHSTASELGDTLKAAIERHREAGDLVLCISAGGGHSLDEWLRREFGRQDARAKA